MPLVIFFEHGIPVDGSLTGRCVDARDVELRRVVRARSRPEELAVVTVDHPYPSGFSNGCHNVAFLAPRNFRAEPFDFLGIRIERRAKQNALMRVILVPIVSWQVLVIPVELSRVRI